MPLDPGTRSLPAPTTQGPPSISISKVPSVHYYTLSIYNPGPGPPSPLVPYKWFVRLRSISCNPCIAKPAQRGKERGYESEIEIERVECIHNPRVLLD